MAINVPIVSQFVPTGINKAVSEFKKLETNGQKAGFALKKAFLPATAALAGLTAAAIPAINKASDLNENLSKTDVVFGDAAESVKTFAKTASLALGQSEIAVLEAAGTFGTFGKAAGLAGQDLSVFTTDFITLASDLASFNNTTPEDAIEAIGAALRGESEPLRRYGVLLNDASLKAKAMEMGIYNGAGALDQQAKILAAQELIYEQTSDAQGDFSRTSDGLANQQRILAAEFENLQAKLGQALLPIVETLLPKLVALTDWASDHSDVIIAIAAAVGTLAIAIVGMNIALGVWNTLSAITVALNAVLATSFTTLWVATGVGIIVAIIAAVVLLQAKFGLFNPIIAGLKWLFDALWDSMKFQINLVIDVVNLLISAINKIKPGDDLPKIPKLMDDIVTAADNSRTAIDKTRGTMKEFEGQIGNLSDTVFEGTTRVDELDQAFFYWSQNVIGAGDAIDRARGKLNEFYDLLDRRKTLRDLAEDIATIQSEMDDLMPGTDEYQAKWEEIALLFGALDESVSRLPKQYELDLVLAGDWDTLLMALEVANAPIFGPGEEQFVGGTMRGGLTIGAPNITVNMPAGSDGAEVVRALQREAQLRGSLPVRTAAGIKL